MVTRAVMRMLCLAVCLLTSADAATCSELCSMQCSLFYLFFLLKVGELPVENENMNLVADPCFFCEMGKMGKQNWRKGRNLKGKN